MRIRICQLVTLKHQVENEEKVEVRKTLIQEKLKTSRFEEVGLNTNLSKMT